MNQVNLLINLAVALGLSSLIGIEREFRQKSAGLRTHTLVGLGAAVAMIVSKYGFFDVLDPGRVTLDPSRVAAQIVVVRPWTMLPRRKISPAPRKPTPVNRSNEPVGVVTVAVQVVGQGSVAELADELGHIEGVIRVSAGDSNVITA